MNDAVAYALIGVLIVLLIGVIVRSWIRSRALRRRIASVVARLSRADALSEVEDSRGLEAAFGQLERASDDAARATSDWVAGRRCFTESLGSLDEGIVIADETGEITYANPPAEEFLDASRVNAIVDRTLRDEIARAISSGSGTERELELMGPPRRTLGIHVSALDDDERTIGACALVVDLSARRRIDEVRRDFVANISHELKTPVAALGLLAETLNDTLDEPEVAARLAGRLIGESERLVGIIDDLIELSRIEAESSPARGQVSLDVVTAGAIERVRNDHHGTDVNVRSEIDPEVRVFGDRRQLASAIYNLIQNAVKYSDPDSPVEVTTRADDDWVVLDVTDRGIGIPDKELNRIFERFYRVDRDRSRQSGGTGLGLAIVRHIARNHGGDVVATSLEDVGSTFSLYLPARIDPEIGPEQISPAASAGTINDTESDSLESDAIDGPQHGFDESAGWSGDAADSENDEDMSGGNSGERLDADDTGEFDVVGADAGGDSAS